MSPPRALPWGFRRKDYALGSADDRRRQALLRRQARRPGDAARAWARLGAACHAMGLRVTTATRAAVEQEEAWARARASDHMWPSDHFFDDFPSGHHFCGQLAGGAWSARGDDMDTHAIPSTYAIPTAAAEFLRQGADLMLHQRATALSVSLNVLRSGPPMPELEETMPAFDSGREIRRDIYTLLRDADEPAAGSSIVVDPSLLVPVLPHAKRVAAARLRWRADATGSRRIDRVEVATLAHVIDALDTLIEMTTVAEPEQEGTTDAP